MLDQEISRDKLLRLHESRGRGRSLYKRWVVVLLSVLLIAPACGSDDDSQMDLTLAGSSTSSSVYGFLLTHARLAGQADGAITVNVRESSTSDNPGLVSQGSVDYGIAGLNALARSYKGTGQYEGNQSPDSRLLMTYLTVAEMLVVRSDKGIATVQDLEGMSFAPSMQGSPIYTKVLEMLAALGVSVDVFDGALEDVVSAMKDNRIVGFGKAGAGKAADASMLDAASAVPVTLIGFSDADIAAIQAVHPNFNFTEVPAGALMDSPAVNQSTIDAVYFTDASMSEDDAYRLTKALWTTLQASADESGYAASSGIVAEQTVEASRLVPLHPGAERYWREIGVLD
tara:strand:- start:2282 stop:3307 length:1026 start_codon:yes stop_codon:yes gene_type:complete